MNFGYNNNITMVHNNFIYITVIATNAAGLKDISYSDPILVELMWKPKHIFQQLLLLKILFDIYREETNMN
jgi:hypothetical protein